MDKEKLIKHFKPFIKHAFNLKAIKATKITPSFAFEEIKNNIVIRTIDDQFNRDEIDKNNITDFEEHLKKLSSIIKRSNRDKLQFQALYGQLIGDYFILFTKKILTEGGRENWSAYCKHTLGLSDGYLRKIRWLGKISKKFKAFSYLNLSLRSLYNMKRAIDVLLMHNSYKKEQKFLNSLDIADLT